MKTLTAGDLIQQLLRIERLRKEPDRAVGETANVHETLAKGFAMCQDRPGRIEGVSHGRRSLEPLKQGSGDR